MTQSRAQRCEATMREAADLAHRNGMTLRNHSDGCYQLRHVAKGWIINLYPRHGGFSPRVYHDPHHRGPFLALPRMWTLLDVVRAAIAQEGRERGAVEVVRGKAEP